MSVSIINSKKVDIQTSEAVIKNSEYQVEEVFTLEADERIILENSQIHVEDVVRLISPNLVFMSDFSVESKHDQIVINGVNLTSSHDLHFYANRMRCNNSTIEAKNIYLPYNFIEDNCQLVGEVSYSYQGIFNYYFDLLLPSIF